MSLYTALQSSPFRDRLCAYLLPYFLLVCPDYHQAQTEILETLASYGARTRSEFIYAARIVALSFTSLDLLAQAKATAEMPPNIALKYIAAGNSLARSAHQNEVALAKRLTCDVPNATAAEPVDDISLEETDEAIRQAEAKVETYRNRLSGNPPHAPTQPDPNQRPWSSSMIAALLKEPTAARPAA